MTWSGTDEEYRDLLRAVGRHCTCPPLARRILDRSRCPAHALLRDEATLDRLLVHRRSAARLLREERNA